MPRIAVCTNYADRDDPHFSGENEHYDFCCVCYRMADDEDLAEENSVPAEAVDRDVEHPSYDEWDYTCHMCGDTLTVRDN
jgi:hypothetical protein